MQDRFLSAIGLAKCSGKAVCGTEMVRDSVKRKKAHLIVLASDVSDGTRKEILDTAVFYEAEYIISCYTMAQLSSAMGLLRNVSSLAVTDKNIAILIKNSITKM